MASVKEFIHRNREQLLRYLDDEAPSIHVDRGPLEFVDSVIAEWSKLFGGKHIHAPTRRERTFWYALYLFEELQEVPPAAKSDPYVKLQQDNLARVRELLRANVDLPPEFYATRPGEEFGESDWLEDEFDEAVEKRLARSGDDG